MTTTTLPEYLTTGQEFIIHSRVAGAAADTYVVLERDPQVMVHGASKGFAPFVHLVGRDRTGAKVEIEADLKTLCYLY